MMKTKKLLLLVSVLAIISSCSKDADEINPTTSSNTTSSQSYILGKKEYKKVTRTYKETFSAVSTITPGVDGLYNPGTGTGKATGMGKASYLFNQKIVLINGQPAGSVAAPVNQFYATRLANAGINNLPNTVSSITYDDDKNSIWYTSSGGTTLLPVSATRVDFFATLTIIGGTGKYAGATGSVKMIGSFNPQTVSQVATINTSGSISYFVSDENED